DRQRRHHDLARREGRDHADVDPPVEAQRLKDRLDEPAQPAADRVLDCVAGFKVFAVRGRFIERLLDRVDFSPILITLFNELLDRGGYNVVVCFKLLLYLGREAFD
ncbi:hypothetical protein RZS08_01935, partial [Arthrospira platensis SPKY1]|nr:hypothetical protein [Arthrospira platensis SPKY1]